MISWAGMYQGQTSSVEITVYDHYVSRDDFMGRYVLGSDKQSGDHSV